MPRRRPAAINPPGCKGAPDGELWDRAANGDGEAFGCLFDRHSQAIYNYCFRRTADWGAAEDLMSATFLHAWRRRMDVHFTPHGSALPWLYGIATNLSRRHLRSVGRLRRMAKSLPLSTPEPDLADEVVERMDDAQKMRAVLKAIRLLSRDEQDLISLCVWQKLSYSETALALGIPVGTVRSRLSRARARLRIQFGKGPDGLGELQEGPGDKQETDLIAHERKGQN